MGEVILSSKNLVKTYRNGKDRLIVLNGLSINIASGSISTIVGESGSGKSTLLNVLSSLDSFDQGDLVIDGKDMKSLSEEDLSKFRNETIGFIFQFHHLLPDFTVNENILMPIWIKSGYKKNQESLNLLDDFGLIKLKDKYPNEISGGERQRVAIIRAIINKPKIIFADEPSGNLDEKNSIKLIDLFKTINRDYGTTILLTTHNPQIASIGSKIFELKSGELKEK
jgi:ABC-type lipoprotein export system ATPase subunit